MILKYVILRCIHIRATCDQWVCLYLFQIIVAIGLSTLMFGVGASTDPILLSNVNCSGQEKNISECNHSGVNNVPICVHGDDAGVICEGECTLRVCVCILQYFMINSHRVYIIYCSYYI